MDPSLPLPFLSPFSTQRRSLLRRGRLRRPRATPTTLVPMGLGSRDVSPTDLLDHVSWADPCVQQDGELAPLRLAQLGEGWAVTGCGPRGCRLFFHGFSSFAAFWHGGSSQHIVECSSSGKFSNPGRGVCVSFCSFLTSLLLVSLLLP